MSHSKRGIAAEMIMHIMSSKATVLDSNAALSVPVCMVIPQLLCTRERRGRRGERGGGGGSGRGVA